MPDAKHDNRLWVYATVFGLACWILGIINTSAFGIGLYKSDQLAGEPVIRRIPHMLTPTLLHAALIGLALYVIYSLFPYMLLRGRRPHLAHDCPYCGKQPVRGHVLHCPNGDPIEAASVRQWNSDVETIADHLDSDRTCERCKRPIIIREDRTEDGATSYTAACECASAESRFPDEAIRQRARIAGKPVPPPSHSLKPESIVALLNGRESHRED